MAGGGRLTALRLSDDDFTAIAIGEKAILEAATPETVVAGIAVTDDPRPFPLAHVEGGAVWLHKKAILALVDDEHGARQVVRNLLRWGLERLRIRAGTP